MHVVSPHFAPDIDPDASAPIDLADAATPASQPLVKKERLLGIDVARSLAMLGMLYAHFGDAAKNSKANVSHVVHFMDGRAMPLFVLLSGIGAELLLRRSQRPVRQMLARAAIMIPLGLFFSFMQAGPAVILQYYALFFVLAALIRKASTRSLLLGAVGVLVASTLMRFTVFSRLPIPFWSVENAPTWGGLSYVKRPDMLLLELTARGYYPVFPAFAFFLFGMWLARQNLSSTRVQATLLAGGFAVAAVIYPLGWATDSHRSLTKAEKEQLGPPGETAIRAAALGFTLEQALRYQAMVMGDSYDGMVSDLAKREGATPDQISQLITQVDQSPPLKKLRTPTAWSLLNVRGHSEMPGWVIASAGFATSLLGASLLLAQRFRKAIRPLAMAGQLSLTMYVFHLYLFRHPMKRWPWELSANHLMLLTTAGFAGFVLFANLWRWKFTVGPVEALVRFSGRIGEGRTSS
jgi:uncharacterized membrane protein